MLHMVMCCPTLELVGAYLRQWELPVNRVEVIEWDTDGGRRYPVEQAGDYSRDGYFSWWLGGLGTSGRELAGFLKKKHNRAGLKPASTKII